MDWFASIITGKEPVIVAGAAGGVVRWIRLKERFLDGVLSIAVGAVCALYVSPVLEPLVSGWIPHDAITETQRIGFSGFIIGLLGVGSVGFILDAARNIRKTGG